jgi:hypothetical protein
MGPGFQATNADRQPAGDPVQAAAQAPAAAERAGPQAAEPEARQEELRARSDALMWAALLGGDGWRFVPTPGNAAHRSRSQALQVGAGEMAGRADLTTGEPQLASYNDTVKVSDAEGRSTTVTLLNVRSLSRAELARRAVEPARAGEGSNLP